MTEPNEFTREQLAAALGVVAALGDTVKSLGSVPSGHLYARVMDTMSLQMYQAAIALLVRAKLVKEENHLLTWIGEEL